MLPSQPSFHVWRVDGLVKHSCLPLSQSTLVSLSWRGVQRGKEGVAPLKPWD